MAAAAVPQHAVQCTTNRLALPTSVPDIITLPKALGNAPKERGEEWHHTPVERSIICLVIANMAPPCTHSHRAAARAGQPAGAGGCTRHSSVCPCRESVAQWEQKQSCTRHWAVLAFRHVVDTPKFQAKEGRNHTAATFGQCPQAWPRATCPTQHARLKVARLHGSALQVRE